MRRRRIKFSDFYHNIIMNEVADIYNVERDRIFLGSRQKNIIFAKRLYIYILREMFGLTLTEIANVTNLHHASVIHHSRQFKFFHENYKQDQKNFQRVENKIIEVEVDEEIQGLEKKLKSIKKSLTKLYKIKKLKDEREKIKNLLTE
tara:strand:+ start:374 stop:814 length:441 start_codon:yes stop_codon:yes gene_type:complete